ncbi:MAG TPA: PH domain-containing protein [Propionibacteriaceae bacterium]|nr:PH domain-containing protein [Propionibacteriaceae bacterium]
MAGRGGWFDPDVEKYVLEEAGERLVLEVRKHWVASFVAGLRLVLGTVVFVTAWAFDGPLFWILFLIGLVVMVQAGWRMLEEYRDRFVITNQRVFRVNGVFSTARASVPLGRILDITVKKPLVGHWLNYGHFVFESAAQVQGLKDIRYVADIDVREDILRKTMQGETTAVTIAPPEEDDGT